MFVASTQSHARSIESKDIYTADHCDRVERYSELLARQAGGFSEEWIFNLRIGAILHDIGKIGVPTSLLCKPGMLSVEEQLQVQSHPVIGGRIVRAMEEFKLESSVRHHHECFDGKGYPDGLKGEAIPIEARLILAADTFDAMTSNRPYRRALSTDRAIDELKKFSGKQFDPEVVRWMVQAAPSLEEARQNSSKTVNPLKEMAEAV
jgi:HD-GYP domain-containing protein (c-di-GMP phosphodiesterase class II)